MSRIFFGSMLLLVIVCDSSCTENTRLSPFFNLTETDLVKLTEELPEELAIQICNQAIDFLMQLHYVLLAPDELSWLVDKTHSLSREYEPPDLQELRKFNVKTTRESLLLREMVLKDFLAMFRAAQGEGIELVCASTYRSYANQEQVYRYWVKTLGQERADRESARPGTSQHQLGTTIDFFPITDKFADSPAFSWLVANGWKFGFSLSYPRDSLKLTGYKFEPWHWRYIGKESALMSKLYFNGLQQLWLEFWYQQGDAFRRAWLLSHE